MGITVNTNMSALKIQTNLSNATRKMNTAMERMSSGSKINSAKDDAAGYAVSTKLTSTISGTKVASDNVAIGQDMLSTADGVLTVVSSNLSRIKDLTEQASNGTYTTEDLNAIAAEVGARLSNATFNGKKLFSGTNGTAVSIQSGTTASEKTVLSSVIFSAVNLTSLSLLTSQIKAGNTSIIASNLIKVDTLLTGANSINARQTQIGAAQNKLTAVTDALSVQTTNMTSALSTVKDADVAQESASYVQQQILQSASSTLLTQANSAPQIALTLIKGQ